MVRKLGKISCCRFGRKLRNRFAPKDCDQQVTPLSKRMRSGRIKVCKVAGDRKVCARMAAMGLYPGVEADIVCPENGSQCLLKVNGGTISLDSAISNNIFVSNP